MAFLLGMLGMVTIGTLAFMGSGDDDDLSNGGSGVAGDEDAETGEAEATDGAVVIDTGTLMSGPETTFLESLNLDNPDTNLSEPNETSSGSDESDQVHEDIGVDNPEGGEGNSSDESDLIRGDIGADHLEGGEGNDSLFGNEGNDTLLGQNGHDLLDGGADDDTIYGHDGDDTLKGGDGDDYLDGGVGNDLLQGGERNDAFEGDDTLIGGDGNDTIFGGWGNDFLSGLDSEGNDDSKEDYLNGGDGQDSIVAGVSDVVTGGAGADQITLVHDVISGPAATIMDFVSGEDTLLIEYDGVDDALEVDIVQEEADPELYRVLVDGAEVALVYSTDGIALADISLVFRNGL